MSIADILLKELDGDGQRLGGSNVTFTFPLTDAFINSVVQRVKISTLPNNRVRANWGVFDVSATLPNSSNLDNDTITITLGSWLIAQGLRPFLHLPHVHIKGTMLTVFLRRIPQLAPFFRFRKYVNSISFTTSKGALWVTVKAKIDRLGSIAVPATIPPHIPLPPLSTDEEWWKV